MAEDAKRALPDEYRLISVADVHGDCDALKLILTKLGLIDASGHWAGGRTTLVQTGDLVDRGAQFEEVLKLLVQLQQEAPQSGGRVILMLGNHELMNLMGDAAYTPPEEIEEAGGEEGWRLSWEPAGNIGSTVRANLQGIARVEGVLFSHAGVPPKLAQLVTREGEGVDVFNSWLHRALAHSMSEIAQMAATSSRDRRDLDSQLKLQPQDEGAMTAGEFLDKHPGLALGDPGPFWTRSFAKGLQKQACKEVALTLKAFRVSRMVVGHTPQFSGDVGVRCSGQLILADTAISSGMVSTPGTNHPSALEFDTRTGAGVAHYFRPNGWEEDGRQVPLPDVPLTEQGPAFTSEAMQASPALTAGAAPSRAAADVAWPSGGASLRGQVLTPQPPLGFDELAESGSCSRMLLASMPTLAAVLAIVMLLAAMGLKPWPWRKCMHRHLGVRAGVGGYGLND